jgi:class 3 adenylate cyclase
VLVSQAVVDAIDGMPHLEFEAIGQVKLKGFDEPVPLCRATAKE